jgi:hypothetical protein
MSINRLEWVHSKVFFISCIKAFALAYDVILIRCNCYDRFYRDLRPEKLGNSLELVSVHNKTVSFGEELWVHIPKYIKVNDIIAINHTFPTGVPSICLH